MRGAWSLLLVLGVGASACRLFDGGLEERAAPDSGADAAGWDGPGSLDAPSFDRNGNEADEAGLHDAVSIEVMLPPGDAGVGPPGVVGCADGAREGFLDQRNWPDIAGCAGAFRIPGVLGQSGHEPRCDRRAGDDGVDRDGAGCGVADLCAPGWHVCRDADEVRRRSRTGCESAVPAGTSRFFLVLSGASPQGICNPDSTAANDLHGCGTIGQPESVSCQPLDRRMGFADCTASKGFFCGTADDHLNEANLVVNSSPAAGGALCCIDN